MSYNKGKNFNKNKKKTVSDMVIVSDFTSMENDDKRLLTSTKAINVCQAFSVIIPKNMLEHITVPYDITMSTEAILSKCGGNEEAAARYSRLSAVGISNPGVQQ
jgi:hypothetical protein